MVITHVKTSEDKIEDTHFKKLNFIQTLHPTHFLKLLDKMYQYEIDPASIAEDREWAPIRPQTDEVKPVHPFQLRCAWDITIPWRF